MSEEISKALGKENVVRFGVLLVSSKANNLVPLELILEISSRLIVNSAAFNTKHSQINNWIKKIKKSL